MGHHREEQGRGCLQAKRSISKETQRDIGRQQPKAFGPSWSGVADNYSTVVVMKSKALRNILRLHLRNILNGHVGWE